LSGTRPNQFLALRMVSLRHDYSSGERSDDTLGLLRRLTDCFTLNYVRSIMRSRRFGPRRSKRLRILRKQLDSWTPAYRPEAAMNTRYSKTRMTAPGTWIFSLLGFYSFLFAVILEFLFLITTAGVLLHAFVLLQLCRSVLAPPASSYFGDLMTNGNYCIQRGLRLLHNLLRHLHRLNTLGFQQYLLED